MFPSFLGGTGVEVGGRVDENSELQLEICYQCVVIVYLITKAIIGKHILKR